MKIFKETPQEMHENRNLKETVKEKYLTFQNLLKANNSVHELMADMKEKLSGEYLFDRHYIESHTGAITHGVETIIKSLNAISKGKYAALYERFRYIDSEIKKLLYGKKEIPFSPYTISFHEIGKESVEITGGKNANLGELKNRLNIRTPEGFVITTYAYKRFMEHGGFFGHINNKLSELRIEKLEEINKVSKEIQDLIIKAEVPEDMENAIKESVEKLKVQNPTNNLQPSTLQPFNFSVRSSAVQEDGEFSFAGQYSTFLNVPPELVIQKYKEVVASLFIPRAIFYYKAKGFHESEMVMSVGVLEMVDARAGGVIYSLDPDNAHKDTLIINAVKGLGKYAVEGTVTPETYTVLKQPRINVLGKSIPSQKNMLICRHDEGLEDVPVADDIKGKPSLTDEQIIKLAECAVSIENHYKSPQDIEWAIDSRGAVYILQTRNLRVFDREAGKFIPPRMDGYNILIDKGSIASRGIGFGRAFIVKTMEDLNNFPENAVLVAKNPSTEFVTVMNRANAIITDMGGTTVHMASLAREFGVPAILNTGIATSIIKNGQEITVDAFNCNVYEGCVRELIELSKKEEAFKKVEIFKTLQNVLKWVIPLNLVDPDSKNFCPESCESFHDISRFCHEMAMKEMFKLTEEPMSQTGGAVRLFSCIPIRVHLIDLGGGIKEMHKKLLPEHIASTPFNAFFKGLTSMKWPDPRPVDAKGFMAMIAHTAAIPEAELQKTGEESYSFISKEYMNFSIRLGYHLSVVEAYAGDNIIDNYIRFFFKGGGAARDRRLNRVRLIKEILKKLGFSVKVMEDMIEAVLNKYRQSDIKGVLEIVGCLTVYTKQLDMALYNDAITDMFIEEFTKNHILKHDSFRRLFCSN